MSFMHLSVALGFLQFLGKVTSGLQELVALQKGQSEDASVKAGILTFSVLIDKIKYHY